MSITIRRAVTRVNDLRLFYLDAGSGDQTIVCLHGRWGRGETWSDLITRHGSDYRIIAPDQRGHGLSDKPCASNTGEEMARDIHDLLTVLDIDPVIAVGHSMGGRIAGYLAALYPEMVQALAILDEPAGGHGRPESAPLPEVPTDDGLTGDWPTPYPTYRDAVADLEGRFPLASNVRYFLDSLVETEAGYDFLFSRPALGAIGMLARNWYHLLPGISCPVLLVRAVDSWCFPAAEVAPMREAIKDCTFAEISGSDHMVYADNPSEFYKVFDDFLRRVTTPQAAMRDR